MKELESSYIFMEIYHSIYHNFLDAMFKMEKDGISIFEKVIPRMGGFHMIRTIYSLNELLSTAGLRGKVSIKKNIEGHKRSNIFVQVSFGRIASVESLVHEINTTRAFGITSTLGRVHKRKNIDIMLDKSYTKALPKLSGYMEQWIESLLDMINMLLNMVHFQRSDNWKDFLEIFHEFLQYCFYQNHHNYARNMSYLYCHMLRLKNR